MKTIAYKVHNVRHRLACKANRDRHRVKLIMTRGLFPMPVL